MSHIHFMRGELPSQEQIEEIGPTFQPEEKYTTLQLRNFIENVCKLRSFYSSNIGDLRTSNPDAAVALSTIFRDEQLANAHLYFRLLQPPSKDLMLRYLERFCTILKMANATIDYERWFILEPTSAHIWHPSPSILSPAGLRQIERIQPAHHLNPSDTEDLQIGELRRTISTLQLTFDDFK